MQKAAFIAGVFQLLNAMFNVAPQMFGTSFSFAPGQTAFRAFTVISCLAFAIFFFGIASAPAPNVGGAVRMASVLAAATMTIENLPSVFATIRGVAPYIDETALWRFHPLRQFGYVLGLTVNLLSGITLVVFLLFVFAKTLEPQNLTPDEQNQSEFLRLASFTVAAVSVIGLIGTIISMMAARSMNPSALRILLRFATLASFVAFFFVFGRNQHQPQNPE